MKKGGESMARKKTTPTKKKEVQYKECIKCKKQKNLLLQFYSTTSDLYPDKKYPICKDCLTKNLPEDQESMDYLEAVKNILADLNKPFLILVWEASILESRERKMNLFGMYMKNIFLNYKDLTFKDSEFIPQSKSNREETIIPNSNGQKSNAIISQSNFFEKDVELTEEDVKTQQDCIRLLGYDPFAGYSMFDRKFLYAELIPYLDEDTLEDQYKISIIIQLLNNNNQIRKIDLLINKLSSDEKSLLTNSSEIKSLTSIKKEITNNNDKLSKENAIAIKHRGDKTAGKSTLTYLMKNYRELGFEDAEQDYYDQKKAYGMKLVADVSNRSIIEQLQFDENDVNDMLFTQRQLLQELQTKVSELEEENRQLHERIGILMSSDEN